MSAVATPTDLELVAAVEDGSLPPSAFDHRAHVRLAWIYLREQPLLDALQRFIITLRRYATSLGAASKYHETVTYAFVFLIHERMQRNPALTFDAFIATNEDLRVPILTRYYLPATLSSELAKATFVMPDRASA